jgi:leader peptidase (prepilin peptidase) / N-methyltransferase
MGLETIFTGRYWAAVPFEFWALVFFVFGSMVGSFLNVCIHRMPRGESLVSPPSHCPHCGYSIPWYLNVPLITWLMLRGRCRNCAEPISARYVLVELLTGLLFLGCWLGFGRESVGLTLVYCLLGAGLIAASFIDFEHFIIPDEITIGGAVLGFLLSPLVPALHGVETAAGAIERSVLGILLGAGSMYAILRVAKLFYGRQRFELPADTEVHFTETSLRLPDRELPYEEVFYRKSDTIVLRAKTVEMIDRGYAQVRVRLSPHRLQVGEDEFKPEEVSYLKVVTDEIVVPREAMGLGDVKFMAAIGAFLGWKAVGFILMVSAMIGAAVGLTLVALKRSELSSSRLPYGPYIALAAILWIFRGPAIVDWWWRLWESPLLF